MKILYSTHPGRSGQAITSTGNMPRRPDTRATRPNPVSTGFPGAHDSFSSLGSNNGQRCFPGRLMLNSGTAPLFLCRRQQNRLPGPDAQKKHPEKEAETDHPDTQQTTQAELKPEPFSGSALFPGSGCFLPGHGGVTGYIFSGVLRPTRRKPLPITVLSPAQRASRAPVRSGSPPRTLCLL